MSRRSHAREELGGARARPQGWPRTRQSPTPEQPADIARVAASARWKTDKATALRLVQFPSYPCELSCSDPCPCYVPNLAEWRRGDERRRTAVPPRKRGTEGIGSKQGGVADAAGRKGCARPLRMGSRRVRAKERTLLSCSRRAYVWPRPSAHEPGRDDAPSDPPISKPAAERRRLKWRARNAGSSATNGASPSL
jgi:hypothetical protein